MQVRSSPFGSPVRLARSSCKVSPQSPKTKKTHRSSCKVSGFESKNALSGQVLDSPKRLKTL